MKKRKYSAGGGVPTTGENYGGIPAQYPFPSSNVGESGITSNTSVNINGQEVETQSEQSKLTKSDTNQYRRGGKVKRVRGDGIAQRGRTRGRFV
jgi:hypothetical protein